MNVTPAKTCNLELVGAFTLYDEQHENVDITKITPSIEHILRSLPKINRFNGHTAVPYDVAMHSVQCTLAAQSVYGIVKPYLLLAVLMHDSAEAYISDIPRPIKRAFFPEISEIEDRVKLNILETLFEIHPVHLEKMHEKWFIDTLAELDLRMACTEYDTLGETLLLPEVPRLKLKKDAFDTDWRKSTYAFAKMLNYLTTRTTDSAPRFANLSEFISATRRVISGVKSVDSGPDRVFV